MSVANALIERGHDAVLVRDRLAQDAPDPLVATAAVEDGRVLVSHDNDMRRIERKLSPAHRERFPSLSRLMLCLPEPVAAARLVAFLPIIELDFEIATNAGTAMMFEVCERRVRLHR